jgi:hypothetical protein
VIPQEENETRKRNPKKTPRFDLPRYLIDQARDSLSELNIHATCVEHECSREYVLEHPDLLIKHYNENGGAKNYEKYRSRYVSVCEYSESCRFGSDCELALTQTDYLKCPLRKMSENCRCMCRFACPKPPLNIISSDELACAI